MSLSNAQRARLGVFIVAGITLVCIFLAIPIGFRLRDKKKEYYSFFSGESLSGLERGASVKYLGRPIGKVDRLDYDARDLSRIKVIMKVDDEFPLKADMFAQTAMVGITGLMFVDIQGGTNEAALLPPHSELATRRSTMSVLTGNVEEIVAKVELLLNHLTVITHPDSLRSVKRILDNVAVITGDARVFMDNVRPNIENVAGSSQRVLATLDSISQDVKAMTGEIRTSIADGQMSRIMASVDSSAQSLKKLSETLDLTIKQSREDIRVSLENLREALENANELSKLLAENPSLLIKGEQQHERAVR